MSGDMYQRLYEQFFKGSAEERMPLTPAELELAGFIHPIVTAFLKNILSNSGSDTDACETQDFQDKLRLARTNLKVIIEMFSESDAARKEFVCEYPSYARKRGESISHLRNLATSINTDKHNCNISQVTGSSVGILGATDEDTLNRLISCYDLAVPRVFNAVFICYAEEQERTGKDDLDASSVPRIYDCVANVIAPLKRNEMLQMNTYAFCLGKTALQSNCAIPAGV